MNVITLSNDQLTLVLSTLQKVRTSLMEDLNVCGDISETSVDLLNDHYDLVDSTIKEFQDCNTPKVVAPLKIRKAPKLTLQEAAQPGEPWKDARSLARALNIDSKRLYNRKDAGKFQKGVHWQKVNGKFLWNLETIREFFRAENSH